MMVRFPLLIFLLIGSQMVSVVAGASVRPEQLTCEYLKHPVGIGAAVPRLTWIPVAISAQERGQRQTAYQILAASSPESLAKDWGDLWDSGRVESNSTALVSWGGKPLTSRVRVLWKVRLWDEANQCGEWGEPASFSTGLDG
jgi:alpha-L-rhamnosidase